VRPFGSAVAYGSVVSIVYRCKFIEEWKLNHMNSCHWGRANSELIKNKRNEQSWLYVK
jgi:hypothetical protein